MSAQMDKDLKNLMQQIKAHREELHKLLIRSEDLQATVESATVEHHRIVAEFRRRKSAN